MAMKDTHYRPGGGQRFNEAKNSTEKTEKLPVVFREEKETAGRTWKTKGLTCVDSSASSDT